jgi:hypothetical protein
MLGTRASKRQAGKAVDEEIVSKRPARAAAPNQQSLAGFDKKVQASMQPKSVVKPKPRGRSRGPLRHNTPCPVAEPIDQPPFNPIGNVPRSSPTRSQLASPLINPPRGPTRVPFDPSKEQPGHAQMVSIALQWSVDGGKEEVFYESQNINDIFRDNYDWKDLKKLVQKEIDFWADKRNLIGSRAPIPDEWRATLGKPAKTIPTVRLTDEVSWKRLLTELRAQDHVSKGREGGKVHVLCTFICIDHPPTPPPKVDTKKGKSQPKRVRAVRFGREDREKDDESENEAESGSEVDQRNVLEGITMKPGRRSATKNQLDAKRRKDALATAYELTRQQIFDKWLCKEPRCQNRRACCYPIEDGKRHHQVTPDA